MSNLADITCRYNIRREKILADPSRNGIDYIEVPKDDQRKIRVYFINTPPPSLLINEIKIEGGVRIKNILVTDCTVKTDLNSNSYLEVRVDQTGDFSTYTLVIESSKVDIVFSRKTFSFKAGCPSDFDCYGKIVCPEILKKEPIIDYLAKDYASFRQALLDLIPSVIPGWKERHEADFGITLVELLAYAADQLSYYQDAVANEAYLETAHQRESVKRHARLIDYNMHDGANSFAFIQFQLIDNTSGSLPKGTQILNRINIPLGPNCLPPHGPVIPSTCKEQALKAADVIFETINKVDLGYKLNEIKIYTWGNRLCCVPRGTTAIELVGDLAFDPVKDGPKGSRREIWRLKKNDFLLFEEVKDPKEGSEADANFNHRQVVRLVDIKETEDKLQNIKLTQVFWHTEDALRFPLCLSSQKEDGTQIDNISVARGNLVLADHGRTIDEWYPADPKVDPSAQGIRLSDIAYRFSLKEGPVTFSKFYKVDDCEYSKTIGVEEKPSVTNLIKVEPRQSKAAVFLEINEEGSDNKKPKWCVVPQLFESKPFDRHFVLETQNNGKALIRFGDDEFGMEPSAGSHLHITYRIGNGSAGNVGRETLVHILEPEPPLPLDWPNIKKNNGVQNPLPAIRGVDPELMKQVKLLAPKAFHAEQFRAVTEDDYAKAAEKHSEVDKAVATFRWTGSWITVFISIDPVGTPDITPELKMRIKNHLTRYKLAAYDVEINPPQYIPLEIEINVCVAREHFRAHVKAALLDALSNKTFVSGHRGFFHPDNYTFGQPVYLSKLYNTIEKVAGVDSAEVIVFKRYAKTMNHESEKGYIIIGRLEIARLDNDPNFPENGLLRLNMMSGK